MPTVSVIIPTYNRHDLLMRAVNSVLAQSWQDFEVIVVDDESTDDTEATFKYYPDPRVKYVRQSNAGPSAARNNGGRVSSGQYLTYLDSDDAFLPGKLEVQVAALIANPSWGLVAGGWTYADATGHVYREEQPWLAAEALDLNTWLNICPIIPSSIMVRRTWMEQIGGWDLRRGEDYDLGLRLSLAGCEMGWTRQSVCAYTVHDGNYIWDGTKARQDLLDVLERVFQNPALPADILPRKDEIRARAFLRGAPHEFAVGQVEEARADLAEALRLDPSLAADRGQEIFEMLVATASSPFTGDGFVYIRTAFDALPPQAGVLRGRRREALAAVAMSRYFAAYERADSETALKMLPIAMRFNPRWLLNRGVLSILARMLAQRVRNRPRASELARPAAATR